jgi:hypothetical protein
MLDRITREPHVNHRVMNKSARFFLVLSLGFLVALSAREVGGFPNCASDEQNWTKIAEQVAKGINWPISGPLHFWIVQIVSERSGLNYQQTLSSLGLVSVPILLILLLWAYEKLGMCGLGIKPIDAIVILVTSSYFLSPMLESRPQQWGQIMVFMGMIFFLLAINKRGAWWPYALLLILTVCTHILSFAILAVGSLILLAIMFMLRRVYFWQIGLFFILLISSMTVFILPDGPYAFMLDDIRKNHLKFSASGYFFLFSIIITPVVVFIYRQNILKLVGTLENIFNRHPSWFGVFITLVMFGILIFQAIILPAGALDPYHGSVWIFFALQAGNLFFAGVLMSGLIHIYRSWQLYPEREYIETLAILLLTMCLIAVTALVLSLWMLETNWFLRVLNYSILFMAPFAAIGFSKIRHKKVKWGIWVLVSIVSYLSVVRPPSLLSC